MKSPFSSHSIKNRATFWILVVFLVSLWMLSLLTSLMLQMDMRRLLGEQQLSVATQLAAGINDELSNRISALEHVAMRIDAGLLADPPALQQMLDEYPGLPRLFNVSVMAIAKDGTSLADVPLEPQRVGRNYLDVDAIATALTEGKPNIGRPLIGRITAIPLLPIAVPILDDGGVVIGALAGAIDLSQPSFFDRITEGTYGKTGGFMLADPQHNLIVTSSVKSRIMEELKPAGDYPVLDRFAAGKEGSAVFIDPLGVEVLGSAKNIPVAGWYLGVRLPTAEAFAPIYDMQRRMTFITLLVTLLTGFVTWQVLRRQLAPIQNTVTTLTRMTHSDQPLQPLPTTDHSEIDELIDGFNRLIAMLRLREEVLQLTRASVDAASDGVYWMTPDARIFDVNPAACRTLGYSREELLTLSIPDIDDSYQEKTWQRYFTEVKEKGSVTVETLHLTRDGRQIPVEIVANYIRFGSKECICAFARDISERKAAAELIRIKNKELEQFVYIVSHDLKGPLVTIKSFLGMLQQDMEEGDTESIASDISFIKGAADKMEQLLAALLKLSRIGRVENAPVQQSTETLVAECLTVLAGSIREQGVEIVTAEMPVMLTGDALQLGQIWQNLIDNAIKYMGDQPHPKIEVGIREQDNEAVFFVCDNGMGIAPENRERIFNLFSQLNPHSGGSGLGLALVKKIIELYQGRIWLESAGAGQGSCFYFTLPGATEQPSGRTGQD